MEQHEVDELTQMWTSPNLINQNAIDEMDTETLEKVLAILDKIQ